MCGIAGILLSASSADLPDELPHAIKKMTDSLAHRGPDGEGYWTNEDKTVVFGHRRLSVLDLSQRADQPMHYLDRYVLLFNGEIYNYVEIKKNLEQQGYLFRTTGDTEILPVLYHIHKTKMLSFLDGMFAFVIYDREEEIIFCARDRFGEKPFFYNYRNNGRFVFASEIKAINSYKGYHDLNYRMIYNYLSFNSTSNPQDLSETFFADIKQLPPAHYLYLDMKTFHLDIKRYWDIDTESIDHSIDADSAKKKLYQLFCNSVNRRLRSDVNIGSSLSGGIDSSLIVCMMDDLLESNRFENTVFRQKTFSARFPGYKKDEGVFMQAVIDNTNVEPHFVYLDGKNFLKDLDEVFYYQDEPFKDASVIAQFSVMKLAKENNVTVLLDGQGADEIFAGYHSYYNVFFRQLEKNNKKKYKVEWNAYRQLHSNNAVNELQQQNTGYKIRKWFPGQANNIKKTVAFLNQKKNNLFNKDFFAAHYGELFTANTSFNDLNKALYHSSMKGDLQTLLRYADRNSMAHSREIRLPFLSHELVDFLFTLPADFKIHNGWTKYLLRSSFEGILPPSITWRLDKIGYEPPADTWLSNAVVQDYIYSCREALQQKGILSKKQPEKKGPRSGLGSWAELMIGKLMEH